MARSSSTGSMPGWRATSPAPSASCASPTTPGGWLPRSSPTPCPLWISPDGSPGPPGSSWASSPTALAGLEGDCLFLDLDLLVLDGIDCFFDHLPGRRCIIHNWKQSHLVFRRRPDVGNSSVFRWRAGTTQFVVDGFLADRDAILARYGFRAPQRYLTVGIGEKAWWPEAWVRSFKRHSTWPFPLNLALAPRLPGNARILVFHGRPDPDQALRGYRQGRLHRRTRPAPWIAGHWTEADR